MRLWRQAFPGRVRGVALGGLIGLVLLAGGGRRSVAQSSLPFEVSNPKHLKWPVEEAGRIYASACELVARSIRPEKPPRLQPKFVLVLGASSNEIVRTDKSAELRMKNWDPGTFAEAMVVLTAREILKSEDVREIARSALISAEATVSVSELKEKR